MKTFLIVLTLVLAAPGWAAPQYAGGQASVISGTYTSGGSITGSAAQTCTLTSFNNSSTATATVALTGTNTIAGGTALTITAPGGGATSAPTTATLGNGTATCSGTATISTTLGYVDSTFTGDTRQNIINNVEDYMVNAGWTSIAGLFTGTYTSGGSITGSAGQTCTLSSFNNSLSGGTATVALTGTNSISGGTALTITAFGSGASSAPTSATLGNGTATCSGTATISTTISSHHSTNVLLQSAQAQSAYQIYLRLKDQSGSSVELYLEGGPPGGSLHPSTYSTGASNGAFLLPGVAKTFRIIASRYQALIYTANATTAREFAWVGMPYVPSFLTSTITAVGFLFADALSDTDTTQRVNLKRHPSLASCCDSGPPNFELLYNGSWWENAGASIKTDSYAGAPRVLFLQPSDFQWTGANGIRWKNNGYFTSDVYVAWGATSSGDEAMIMGQLYDAVYIPDSVAMDTTASFDSPAHTYRNITNSNTGSSSAWFRGGIWFATN